MCVYLTLYCTAISNKQTSKGKKKRKKKLKQPLNKQGIELIHSVTKKGSECYSEKVRAIH